MMKEIMVSTVKFSAATITGSGNITSEAINLNGFIYPISGFFSLFLSTTGAGAVVKAEYLISLDGTTYLTPAEASDIITAHAAGDDIYSFEPVLGTHIKIKLTETAGSNVTAFSAILAVN